jgi:TRAP-type C4-dicarboxylate transport system permease large subunit
MFLIIMFLVSSSSMLDKVMIDNEFMHKIAKRLVQYSSELSGRHYVSVVLILFTYGCTLLFGSCGRLQV